MKIKEITLEHIKGGRNWKIENPKEFSEVELEELTIADCNEFSDDDYVVYSSVFVSDAGKVIPRVLIKEAGDAEYGGDMCEMVEGKWRRVGSNPNPDLNVFGKGYTANPLPGDPSFDTGDINDDERTYNRNEFKRWIDKI